MASLNKDEDFIDCEEISDSESSCDSDTPIDKSSTLNSQNFIKRHQTDYIPKVGMVFSNEVEAYNFYNQYAWNVGFSVRRGQYRRLADGTKRKRLFYCQKEGYRKKTSRPRKFSKLETRSGCQAMIMFTIENGEWIVEQFISEHNHELSNDPDMLRSHRHVSKAQGDVINTLDNAGIGASGIYSYFVEEAGGAQHVGFQKIDCNNFLRNKRIEVLQAGDAQGVINHFKKMQGEDSSFFYTMQVDDQNRLTNFFWRDSRSKVDYLYFCDVVIFDTTYRTNKYNMIFAPFIGVNHHRQNVLLGCAFLLDETAESFVWLFESFLEAMGGQKPTTLFTDQCSAMAKAVAQVFPETQHRLCLWHIGQNAAKHLSHYYGKSGFRSHFNRCLYDCETEEEFEMTWSSLINDFDLVGNKWLDCLYKSRERWCGAFSNDYFSAGIYSTQRSESMNNIFKKVTCKTMPLTKFILRYEKVAERRRRAELVEDVRCNQGTPPGVGRIGGMVKQVAALYTHAMFNIFQDELSLCISIALHEVESNGDSYTYKLVADGNGRENIVKFQSSDCTVECSCKKFSVTGILCCHALRVLNARNIFILPSKYILKRWTKSAKCGVVTDEKVNSLQQKTKRPMKLRMSRIMHKAVHVATKGALMDETSELAERFMDLALEEIESLLRSKDDVNILEKVEGSDVEDDVGKEGSSPPITNEQPLRNPPHIRSKGMRSRRLKGALEKKKNHRGMGILGKSKQYPEKTKKNSKSQRPKFTKDNESSKRGNVYGSTLPDPTYAFNQFIPPLMFDRTHGTQNCELQTSNVLLGNYHMLELSSSQLSQSLNTSWHPSYSSFLQNRDSQEYQFVPPSGQGYPTVPLSGSISEATLVSTSRCLDERDLSLRKDDVNS